MAKGYHKKQLRKQPSQRNPKTTAVIKTNKHYDNPNYLVVRKGSTINAPDLDSQG